MKTTELFPIKNDTTGMTRTTNPDVGFETFQSDVMDELWTSITLQAVFFG